LAAFSLCFVANSGATLAQLWRNFGGYVRG
jgi:hypothetical protein